MSLPPLHEPNPTFEVENLGSKFSFSPTKGKDKNPEKTSEFCHVLSLNRAIPALLKALLVHKTKDLQALKRTSPSLRA